MSEMGSGTGAGTGSAIVLAAIMVLSLAAIGGAAPAVVMPTDSEMAPPWTPATTANDVDSDDVDTDIAVDEVEGTTYWQGQVVEITNLAPGERYEIRRVDGDRSTLVRDRTADQRGLIRLRTGDLEGEYFLRGGDHDRDTTRFRITTQSLSATWAQPTILQDERTSVTLESNRSRYVVAVSAPRLTFAQLAEIFDEDDFAMQYDDRRDENKLLLVVDESTTTFETTFAGIEDGTYEFTFDVTDSTAAVETTLGVGERRGDLSFIDREITTATGDVVNLEIEMDGTRTAYVIIGGRNAGFFDVVRVIDRDRSGSVSLHVNTRYVGLNPDHPGVPGGATQWAYRSSTDSVQIYRGTARLASDRTPNRIRDQIGVSRAGLDRPIGPRDIRVIAATSSDVRTSDGRVDVRTERDRATIRLREPSLDDATTAVKPTGPLDRLTIDSVRTATEREQIAHHDTVILAFDATGLSGHLLAEHHNRMTGLQNNQAEGISLTIQQTDHRADQRPNRLQFHSGMRLLHDPDRDRLYVAIDTRRVDGDRRLLAPGQHYRATLTVTGVGEGHRYNVRSSDAGDYRGNPYWAPGSSESVSTAFRLTERSATVSGLTDAGRLEVPNTSAVTVDGTTSLAPGTELDVRVLSERGERFRMIRSATVATDGTWETNFDFAGRNVGDRFTIAVRDRDETIGAAPGRVIEAPVDVDDPAEPPEEDPEEPPEEEPDDPPEEEPDDDVDEPAEPPDDDVDEPAEPIEENPGFGLLVALIGIGAAIGLFVRFNHNR